MWTPDLLPPSLAPARRGPRHVAAGLLRGASRALDALAVRLAMAPTTAPFEGHEPCLEFYAESGAPEGALYVDGELIGRIAGVKRL